MISTIDFSRQRLFQLLKNEIVNQYRKIVLISGLVVVISFVLTSLVWWGDRSAFQNFFPFVAMLFSGLVFTSILFSDLRDQSSRSFYLMLPCSALEKYLCKVLVSGPIYLAYICLLYAIYMPVSAGLISLVFQVDYAYKGWYMIPSGSSGSINWPGGTTVSVFYLVVNYFFFHALLTLAGTIFRGMVFAKTAIVAALFVISISLVTEVANLFVCGDAPFSAVDSCSQKLKGFLSSNYSEAVFRINVVILLILVFWFHFVSVTSLKERQV